LVGHRWKVPPDPEGEGMRLIKAFLNFVEKAKPQYWLMENVPLAVQYVKKHCDLDPRLITRLGKNMRRAFWGNFPAFFITRDYNKKVIGNFKNTVKVDGKYQLSSVYNNPSFIKSRHSKWEAAKIPFPTAFALGNAVKEALSINSKKGGIQTL